MTKDPLRVNKIFTAVLAGAWTIVISASIGWLLYNPEEAADVRAYPIATADDIPAEATSAEVVEPTEAAPEVDLATSLAAADVEAGTKVARKCAACHTFDEGGANRVGPPLWNIVNRAVAGVEGYSYSSALAGHDGVWNYENLDAFLAAPKTFAPGTKMSFAGIGKASERADLIAYLRTLSDNPAPLP